MKHKSIKNRNLNKSLLLQQMFNFSYAGKCEIFIQSRYDMFELVLNHVHIVDDIFTFSPHFVARYKFDSLYYAILAFNRAVTILTSSIDWFNPSLFEGSDIYDEIFIKD